MPLPTIETPTYELKLPSSNKKIKYRPFLVKEEKILILALESKNQNDITNAVTDVLKKCILTRGVKVDDLPTFDIEVMIFLSQLQHRLNLRLHLMYLKLFFEYLYN